MRVCVLRVNAGRKQPLHLLTPEELSADTLGTMPRQRYPCVVVMAATDSSCIVDHTDVVGLIHFCCCCCQCFLVIVVVKRFIVVVTSVWVFKDVFVAHFPVHKQ